MGAGYFSRESKPADFAVTYISMGYELTAAIEIESQIKDLNIVAVKYLR